ncbi:hypothetical protein BASA50_007658 [Batrachochytrium salamandrivorans]|uniref:Uncharacterized protein n=1 Tax=Batrachochytrium salamandrivorans TaxID=1357716 RepID=A0ABQ8F9I7_9FUNG|nr:hypothetical protein BASA50_007658 [Batrachochytrium salamandrivorans]
MFSCLKTWCEYVLKIFEPCGISSLSEANSATPTTESRTHVHSHCDQNGSHDDPYCRRVPIHQAPQPSAHLPNDPDRIYKTRSDIPEAANPIALATEESASDMVISGCQTQQDSIKDISAKIKEKMDSGVDIAKELDPIKDFVYDDDDKFTFTSHIAIDGIYDLPTKCIVVYDKNDMLQIHDISGGSVSLPHQVTIHPVKSIERYYCRDRPTWTDKCPYEYIMCVISENNTCPDNIQRMFICMPSEEDTDELLTCFMDILGDEEAKEFYTIDH